MSYRFQEVDIKFRTPFAMIIAGPSGSGKTTFLMKLLNEYQRLMYPIPKSILYCYSEYHNHVKTLQEGGVFVHQGVPDDNLLNSQEKPLLLILDDLMQNVNEDYLTTLFTKKSHHKEISVIFMTQDLFQKKVKVARNNSQYIILMRAPNAMLQIRNLGVQIYPGQLAYFLDAYRMATHCKYGYLVIDLHPAQIPDIRLRNKHI